MAMNERSDAWATKSIDAYMKYAAAGCDSRTCAARALEAHQKESGVEGDRGVQIRHLICSLVAHSDVSGYFREHIFGFRQNNGPKLHKVACGVRDYCADLGLDFAVLYAEVCEHLDGKPRAAPSV